MPPASRNPFPFVTNPSSSIAVDLVGPLTPPSSEGHRYILTLIDLATGFPEAVPLRDKDSEMRVDSRCTTPVSSISITVELR